MANMLVSLFFSIFVALRQESNESVPACLVQCRQGIDLRDVENCVCMEAGGG